MSWYIVIMGLMTIPMAFAYVGYRRKINVDRLIIPVCTVLLLFFMACRSSKTGADTGQYVYAFQQISNTPLSNLFTMKIYGVGGGYEFNFEYGYRLFNKLISLISTDGQAITIATSIMTLVLLGILIKKKSCYPLLSIWLYLTLGIFQTEMNMSRNAIAIMICYLGFQFIREKKPVKYLLCVFLASMFHSSSILFVPFYWLFWKVKLTPKFLKRVLITAAALGLGFSIIRPYVVKLLPFGYGRYFSGNTDKIVSLAVGLFHCLVILLVWLMLDKDRRTEVLESDKIGIWMLIAEVIFFCIGFDVDMATRMAALFGPYLLIWVPYLLMNGIKTEKNRFAAVVIMMLFVGLQYVLRISVNNIGTTMPYQFFWTLPV